MKLPEMPKQTAGWHYPRSAGFGNMMRKRNLREDGS